MHNDLRKVCISINSKPITMQNEKIIQAIAAYLGENLIAYHDGYTETLGWKRFVPGMIPEIAREIAAAIAPNLEAGARVSEAQDIIVKVAASLVRQQVTEYAEDLDLPKTTPVTAIRKFETEAQNWNDRNRLRAIELKRAYDLLK